MRDNSTFNQIRATACLENIFSTVQNLTLSSDCYRLRFAMITKMRLCNRLFAQASYFS
jgi:hypothetical protein